MENLTELTPTSNRGKQEANNNDQDIELGTEVKQEVTHMFFDTIGVQFHFSTFFWQLLAHTIFPLFPFMINTTGQVTTLMYTWLSPVYVFIMLLCYGLIDGSSIRGMEGAFVIPLVYFLQHRLVIAMKYGSLSRTEYRKFMECHDRELCVNYRQQMQLASGWLEYHSDVIHFELAAASARIGARINSVYFSMGNPACSTTALNNLRTWNAFLRGHDVVDFSSPPCKQLQMMSDGSYRLSVYDLCEGLIMKASKNLSETNTNNSTVILVFNVANMLIPIVLICVYFDPNMSVFTLVCMALFYITSSAINYVYARTFFGLLYIAIVDVYRERAIMQDLNCMIRLTDLMLHTELSSSAGDVTQYEQSRVDQRVAEIMSIRSVPEAGNNGISPTYNPVHFEDPDAEAPIFKPADATCVIGERIYKDNEAHLTPRICCDESPNIVAWTHARLVMQNFGERFKFRLELYVIAAMAMLLVMMAAGLVELGLSERRMDTFLTPLFLQNLLSVSMCVLFLALIMQTGAQVNEKMEQHNQTLCSHALRLTRKVEHLTEELANTTDPVKIIKINEKIERLNSTAEKIDTMSGVLETSAELKPFKVFGFTAQSSLTMSILTTAFSFYAILISMLSRQDGAALSSIEM